MFTARYGLDHVQSHSLFITFRHSLVLYRSQNIGKYKHNLFPVYITKLFLHNLFQLHVSTLSRAIFRLKIFFCAVNHTINNVILFLSTMSRGTSLKFIHLKLTVELKCCHNTKDTQQQGITNSGGARRGEFFSV